MRFFRSFKGGEGSGGRGIETVLRLRKLASPRRCCGPSRNPPRTRDKLLRTSAWEVRTKRA